MATENNTEDIGAKTDLLKYEVRNTFLSSVLDMFRSCTNMVASIATLTHLAWQDLAESSPIVLSPIQGNRVGKHQLFKSFTKKTQDYSK